MPPKKRESRPARLHRGKLGLWVYRGFNCGYVVARAASLAVCVHCARPMQRGRAGLPGVGWPRCGKVPCSREYGRLLAGKFKMADDPKKVVRRFALS